MNSVDPNEWHIVNGFYDRSADKENCIALIVEIGMAFNRPLAGSLGLGLAAVQARERWCPRRGTLQVSERLAGLLP